VADPTRRPNAREVGEISAAMNRHPDARWIIQLWLELMANAGRNERLRVDLLPELFDLLLGPLEPRRA
jgi:hypothetical protein